MGILQYWEHCLPVHRVKNQSMGVRRFGRPKVNIQEPEDISLQSEIESPDDVNDENQNHLKYKHISTSEMPVTMEDQRMLEAILHIVDKESPIHQNVLAHCVARAMGFYKAGRRIREDVWKMARANFHTTNEEVGEFYWKAGSEADKCISCRPGTDGEPRSVDEVAMPELLALARSISPKPGEDPVVLMARHLGLRRLRTSSRPRLEAAWAEVSRPNQEAVRE